jgi:hypothetical protein
MPLQSGGGTWDTGLYVVRGVGSESRDVDAWHANGLYAEDRGLQVPMVLKHGPVTSSGKSASGPDPRIRHWTQIDMFRPIRMDHTNCLQVAIKTLQLCPSLGTDTSTSRRFRLQVQGLDTSRRCLLTRYDTFSGHMVIRRLHRLDPFYPSKKFLPSPIHRTHHESQVTN